MTKTSSALDAVLDQATAASEAHVPASSALVAQPTGGAVQDYTPPARPSLDDMADNSGIQVDAYLSVKETGLRIDKNPVFQKARVTIDITQCAPIFSVRANRGGQTTFIKSYDGRMTSTGENWMQAISRLQATNDKVDGPYQTVEVPAVLLENVPGAEAGKCLGITPAITGVKFWTKFYKEVRERGLQGGKVEAVISCVPQTNKNGNEWGVVGFELVGAAA